MKRVFILFLSLVVVSSLASQVYEKIIYKSGSWLIDQQDFEGKQILVIRYEGALDLLKTFIPIEHKDSVSFNVNSDVVLKSIYLACKDAKTQRITIESQGMTFGPYETTRMESGEYIFEPSTEILLKKGSYTLNFSSPSILVTDSLTGPAVVITGFDAELYKSFWKQEVVEGQKATHQQSAQKTQPEPVFLGQNVLFENIPAQKIGTNTQIQKKPIQFTLKDSAFLEEVAIDLLFEPADLPETSIVIYDKGDKSYGPYYVRRVDTNKGIIFFSPMVVLQPNTYTVKISDESALNYEKDGKPIYALKSFPYDPPYDFTGTYKINFKVTRIMTLKGSSEKTTLDVKLFEVGVIDHGDFIELVGKIDLREVIQILEEQTKRKVQASYEGQVFPFSQRCEIVESSKEYVKCQFPLQLDFTNIPLVNKFITGQMSTIVVLTFKTRPGLTPGLTIAGSAKYIRIDDPHLGTDINDYAITGDGYRISEKLPPFVVNALNKNFGSAGNIPGPGSAEQAATGLLFPPLVAVIGYALQGLLKPKPGGVAEVFQDYTRASRGAARRAAAKEAEASSSIQEDSQPSEYETSEGYEEVGEEVQEESPMVEETSYSDQPRPQEEKSIEEQPVQQSVEPIKVSVVTDHTGRTKEVTYDPETNQWITQDGNLFNWEVYEKIVVPNLEKDKTWIEQQRDKMTEPTKIEKSKEQAHEEYIQSLEKKYGVSRDQLKDVISQNMGKNVKDAEKFNNDAQWYDSAYKAAKITEIFADNAIDGLAACTGTPGKFVRAAYKGAKAFVPDEEDKGITWGKMISTGTDIASDFIPFSNPWKEAAFKTVGSSIGGAVDEGLEGFQKNLVDSAISNSFEAFAKTIGGKGYGDDVSKYKSKWWNPEMSNLVLPSSKSNVDLLTSSTGKDMSRLVAGKLIREMKLQGAKTAAAYTSEMQIKPLIFD